MHNSNKKETDEIVKLSEQLGSRLHELGYGPADAVGNISHHLAEIAVMGRKLAEHSLPAFLEPPNKGSVQLGDVVADIRWDLDEIKEGVEEMDTDLTKLMNFLNP